MDIEEIQARPRDARGRRACRRLRRQGLVPAVIYGRGRPNVLLNVRLSDVEKIVKARTFIVQVSWDGQRESAQIRELQYDALGDQVVHVDFVRISLTETVTVSVPVEPHGEAAGVAEGGMLDLRAHELDVECLPTAIPEKLRIEVAHLGIGDDVRVRDIAFPEGVEPVAEPDLLVAVVAPPAEVLEEEAEVLPEEAIAEPEVISRQADEGEAEGGPEAE
ncbi:MAG: 50S ribosomal protein L25 [Candidatus Brocadiae bacterium]|nr:50S ribosomal protein L25 [Candidatus Brocadiia bacterium]